MNLEVLREYKRLIRLAFPMSNLLAARRFRRLHPERAREATKRCQHKRYWSDPVSARNRASVKARRLRAANPDSNQASNEWKKRNPGACRAQDARYRARKRTQVVGDSVLIRKIYDRATELRKWFNVVVDHRIPLSKGGLHHPSNLQIIYHVENLRKAARLDYVPSVIFA